MLWPMLALAFIFSIGTVAWSKDVKEKQKLEQSITAENIATVSLEIKEAYKLDNAEYKASVSTPSSIRSSMGNFTIGAAFLALVGILINLFRKKESINYKTAITAVSVVGLFAAFLVAGNESGTIMATIPTLLGVNGIQHLLDARAKVKFQMEDAARKLKDPATADKITSEELNQFDKWDGEFNELTRKINIATKMEQLEANKITKLENQVDAATKVKSVNSVKRMQVWQKSQEFGADKLSNSEQGILAGIEAENETMNAYLRFGINNLSDEEQRILKTLYVGFDGRTNVQTRAQGLTTTAGGYTVPEGFMAEINKFLSYFGGMLDAARVIRTDSGADIPWPSNDDTANTGRLLTEGSDASSGSTDLVYGVTTLKAYNYTSDLIKVARVLLQDTGINLEGHLGEQLGERLGRILNTHTTTGDNSSKPQGFITGATQGKVSASATAFTRSEIIDLLHSVNRAYRNSPKAGFMMHDNILAAIKKLSIGTSDDRPLWQASMQAGTPDKLEGFQYWVNNDMASTLATGNKVMAFGDFNKYIIRIVSGLEILRLNERYAENHQVAFVGFMRFDGRTINTNAIKYLELT